MDGTHVVHGLAARLAAAGLSTEETDLLRRLLTPEEEVAGFGFRAGPLAQRDWLYLVAAAQEYRDSRDRSG